MKKHSYRITVERLAEQDEAASAPLQFEVSNHDEILAIIERIRSQGRFDPASAAAFGLGLKLFGETLLDNRESPPFDALMPHFGEFMKALKKGRP
ncbi:DUF3861 domain-containing protein [Niveibacterium terrae]|uniref:DUF3861 domain-containing protein n=1 Tax=Niveibacterium terrae TaxID=3373598 RepID=UPI003A954504